jgi:hypothetical protein
MPRMDLFFQSSPKSAQFCSMLARSLLNVGEFRPKVHPKLTNKNPRVLAYQSSAKADEGLTRDAKRITKTIRPCDRNEGLNIHISIWDGIPMTHI